MASKTMRLSSLALLSLAAVQYASAAGSSAAPVTCSPDSNYFDNVNCPDGCQCFSNFGGAAPICMYTFDYSKPCHQDSDCNQYGSYYPYCFTARFTGTPGTGYCTSNDPQNWYGERNIRCAGGRQASSSSSAVATPTGSLDSSSSSLSLSSTSSLLDTTSITTTPSELTSYTASSSPTISSSSSISPSPSTALSVLSCDERASGSTFTYKTLEGIYDITCGADYPGGDIKFLWTDSFNACVAACDEENGCLTVAFRSGACYLKNQLTVSSSDAGIWAAKKHDADADAAAKAEATSSPTCLDKVSDTKTYMSSSGKSFKIICGKEYGGGDLSFASTSSFKECIETCSTTTECIDVSYVNGACYLKRSKSSLIEAGYVWTAEMIEQSSSASTTSMLPTSTTSAGTDLTCANAQDDKKSYVAAKGGSFIVECGVDYGGNDLDAVDSTSFTACMDTCDNTDGCVDVSYVWGRCYMKSSAETSVAAGHVWTGRRTKAGPSDAEVVSALNQAGGSFCTSYIDYKAPVVTKATTTTLDASTVLSVQTEKVTTTKFNTAFATSIAVQTLPMLQPRQAVSTPSIVSRWPASRISSVCSLVATGTSTTLSTATATAAPITRVSTFTTLIPVTKTTLVTTVISSSSRVPNPTAAVNLDFETGDDYNWEFRTSSDLYSKQFVSPGHSRGGTTSNFAAQISRNPGTTPYYTYSAFFQQMPQLVSGQTYRIEFSYKYAVDVVEDCEFNMGMWSTGFVSLVTSTKTPSNPNQNALMSVNKCGSDTYFRYIPQAPQQPGEWQRYTLYWRAPSYASSYPKQINIGYQCRGGTFPTKQSVWFDDVVVAPEAAC